MDPFQKAQESQLYTQGAIKVFSQAKWHMEESPQRSAGLRGHTSHTTARQWKNLS